MVRTGFCGNRTRYMEKLELFDEADLIDPVARLTFAAKIRDMLPDNLQVPRFDVVFIPQR